MSGISHSSLSSYQTSGFATKMGWGKRPALLIIDVCQAYFVPPSQSPLSLLDNTAAVTVPDSIRSLLSAAREGGVPVIHTNVVYNSPTMADAGLFWLKAKVLDVWQVGDERGLEGWVEGIKPNDGEHVITKTYASGFFGTALATTLQVLGVDTVVICGVSTSGCVRATALDAMQHGFRPMVVGSACGDRTTEIQNSNLFDLNAKYSDVVSEQEAVEHLRSGW